MPRHGGRNASPDMEALIQESGMGHRFMYQNLIDEETAIAAVRTEAAPLAPCVVIEEV